MEHETKKGEKFYLFLILLFFYLPIFYVVLFSFNSSKSLSHFTGFSLRWYERMFSDRTIMNSIGYTVLCAVIATAVSTLVGTITAIGLSKSRKTLREAVTQVNNLPMLNPDIVTAIGFMLFFTSLRIQTGFTTMVRPTLSTARASWICPHRQTSGWASSRNSRTAVEPT